MLSAGRVRKYATVRLINYQRTDFKEKQILIIMELEVVNLELTNVLGRPSKYQANSQVNAPFAAQLFGQNNQTYQSAGGGGYGQGRYVVRRHLQGPYPS